MGSFRIFLQWPPLRSGLHMQVVRDAEQYDARQGAGSARAEDGLQAIQCDGKVT